MINFQHTFGYITLTRSSKFASYGLPVLLNLNINIMSLYNDYIISNYFINMVLSVYCNWIMIHKNFYLLNIYYYGRIVNVHIGVSLLMSFHSLSFAVAL